MTTNIMTKAEYGDAIDRFYHQAKEICAARRSALSKRIFKTIALQRFAKGYFKYGDWDLKGRNWIWEAQEEAVDELAYTIAELVAKERGL